MDLGNEAIDALAVAREEHRHARCAVSAHARPHNLAPLAVRELVTRRKSVVRPREVDSVAHLVAAWKRLGSGAGAVQQTHHRALRGQIVAPTTSRTSRTWRTVEISMTVDIMGRAIPVADASVGAAGLAVLANGRE